MESNTYRILDTIQGEQDVRALPRKEIPALCGELRDFLVENVTKTGGHLASNLGVVELTVAIHRVFDLPRDRVIFDVGHQSYVHKILSDRKDRFATLRKAGGISGFEKREESEFDVFGTGHASTSVSAALGFAEADRLGGKDTYTIAVLGDGAFTGGMVHEALNNCPPDLRLIIILNENEMSISRNTGALAKHIAKMRSSGRYFRFKRGTKSFLSRVPLIGAPILRGARRIKRAAKDALYGTSYFEGLGLKYLGPVDGNDYDAVENLLTEAKRRGSSVVLHLRTVKGKGYAPAEENPSAYHMVGSAYGGNFSEHFGKTLCEMAQKDDKVCAITAAMQVGVGLSPFAEKYPDRFFDVGIAEEHAVTFAAGLAAAGMKPYVAIYSTFLQRSYDNILHDVALQKLPVRFLVDRASLAGGDGPTHHGIFDVAYLSAVPGLCLFAPATFASLDRFLTASLHAAMPVAIRYPNMGEDARITETFFANGSTDTVAHADFTDPAANRALIVTYGRIVTEALIAAEKLRAQGIPTGVILLETLKPYDLPADRIASLLPSGPAAIVFLEEGVKNGGAGMLTLDKLCERHAAKMANKKTKVLAIEDSFVVRTQEESIYRTAKISANDVLRAMVHLLATMPADPTRNLFRAARQVGSIETEQYYAGKTVLITGGGGSIGSALCRLIARCAPKKLIVLDIYENNAYMLEQELRRVYGASLDFAVEIGSVRDADRLDRLFAYYRPDVVFHAAAHKHVPLMEHSGIEAIKNNVFGTYHTANAAEKYGAEKFILISTDKAVNPTGIMGATKRLCERIVQCRADSKTSFAAVRFGNVLDSSGSVAPLFRQQIEAGGPITVTDRRIVRYFMTIPEACRLVMQAGAMAQSGELFVLDMGKPVKIVELAENMIRQAGLVPYKDIDIVEVGLRPGEKLYEEPLIQTEQLCKTENDLIYIEHDDPPTREAIEADIARLQAFCRTDRAGDADAVKAMLHSLVPAYHAQ